MNRAELDVALDVDDGWWAHAFQQGERETYEREQDTLKRVAAGTATHEDAVFLARRLGYRNLFAPPVEPTNATPIEDDAE